MMTVKLKVLDRRDRYVGPLNGCVMSDIDGLIFTRVLKALEKYSYIIPPDQFATLRDPATLQIFENTNPLSLLAMYIPDEDKIILTFGRKSFDMSMYMYVKKMGFKGVDGSDYMKYEAILDSDRDHPHLLPGAAH
jgi:hypothetical protein